MSSSDDRIAQLEQNLKDAFDVQRTINDKLIDQFEKLSERLTALEQAMETIGGFVSWMMILKQVEVAMDDLVDHPNADKIGVMAHKDPAKLHNLLGGSVQEAVAEFEGQPLTPASMKQMTDAAIAAFRKALEEL